MRTHNVVKFPNKATIEEFCQVCLNTVNISELIVLRHRLCEKVQPPSIKAIEASVWPNVEINNQRSEFDTTSYSVK